MRPASLAGRLLSAGNHDHCKHETETVSPYLCVNHLLIGITLPGLLQPLQALPHFSASPPACLPHLLISSAITFTLHQLLLVQAGLSSLVLLFMSATLLALLLPWLLLALILLIAALPLSQPPNVMMQSGKG
jgi:hypothetical protein